MPIALDSSFDSNGRSKNPIIEFISGSLVVLKPGIPSSSFNNASSMSLAIAASASFALEADPEDNASVQFRVPANSAGVSNDRIAFYVSGSGKIGIGTKDPETPFDVRDIGEDVDPRDRTAKTRILKVSRTSQIFDTPITASSNISTEGILFTDDIRRRTDNSSTTRISMGGNNINVFSGDSTNSHIKMLSTVGTVFNEGGLSVYDFRVEGDTDTHLLFVDAGADKVAVGTNTVSDSLLTVDGDIRTTNITASGNISSSGYVYGNRFYLNNVRALGTSGTELQIGNSNEWTTISYGRNTDDTHVFTGAITASGNISSSGTIISNEITTTTLRAANGNGLIHDKKIWITPTDFDTVSVDGINRGVITDNGGNLADIGRRLTFYAQKYVPTGWKATAVKIEGSDTSDRFTAYSSSFDVGTSAAVCAATAIGTEVSLATAVQGGGGVYLSIEWGSRGNTEVYGGYIQLTEN